jgi:hypothetical protein
MCDDGPIAVFKKVVGSVKDWPRENVSQAVIPVVFPDVFNFGGTDIPIGVIDVPCSDVATFEDARAFALFKPVARGTAWGATALNRPMGHLLENVVPASVENDKHIPVNLGKSVMLVRPLRYRGDVLECPLTRSVDQRFNRHNILSFGFVNKLFGV